MMDPGLLSLVDSNAWSFGPIATALRILELSSRDRQPLQAAWTPILSGCQRMNPLGYWLREINSGRIAATHLVPDLMRRVSMILEQTLTVLQPSERVLLVGHDHDTSQLLRTDVSGRSYRYLFLDGPAGIDSPGTGLEFTGEFPSLGKPFRFTQLEESLDWADSVILSGFLMHSCNLLGPAQLRPFLMSARDQVDRMILLVPSERDLARGSIQSIHYSEDFRPCWWNHSITHLITDRRADRPRMNEQQASPEVEC